ncbi:hypothetical protein EJ06DRAFT_560083 [Trichodelitschia bisporula]|uniref:T6SS Phospholipase effector Tle1-like catalytic domain-containing protein n=1 Tax=Trichodelitschia bisporula TaxID=703511 RepID=A0A6G1HJ90_9PEZI|nr:hypothetical protein EJ06DRAFT_560083 [Trichodelitschia bisporula]
MGSISKKKLIVCCDGTWMNATGSPSAKDIYDRPTDPILQTPSNVTRICRSLTKSDDDGIEQITFYQSGVGSGNIVNSAEGGLVGQGISENIRAAYLFIAANYNQQANDELYLVGFSRGSFTVRSIAAFISDVGLLTPAGMVHFYPIFQDWENQIMPGYKTNFPSRPFPPAPGKSARPNLFSEKAAYVAELHRLGFTTRDVKIKVVACFDTVGSLGIPRIGPFSTEHAVRGMDYAFVDTELPPAVEHAIHALALDEKRKPFAPTMWKLPNPLPGQSLLQVWFPGAHSDVGGSYPDTRSADLTLAWMVSQLERFLSFDEKVLQMQYQLPAKDKDPRPWGCGPIHNSSNPTYWAFGTDPRTPLDYNEYDHTTGKEYQPEIPLIETHEYAHASLRIRQGVPGKDIEDSGPYRPGSLSGWKLQGAAAAPLPSGATLTQVQEAQRNICWVKGEKKLKEAVLEETEWKLLQLVEPGCEVKFCCVVPK